MTEVWPFLPTSYTGSGISSKGSAAIGRAEACCREPEEAPTRLSTYMLLLATLFALLSLLPPMETVVVAEAAAAVLDRGAGWGIK